MHYEIRKESLKTPLTAPSFNNLFYEAEEDCHYKLSGRGSCEFMGSSLITMFRYWNRNIVTESEREIVRIAGDLIETTMNIHGKAYTRIVGLICPRARTKNCHCPTSKILNVIFQVELQSYWWSFHNVGGSQYLHNDV